MARQINSALFNTLNETIHFPFLVLDNKGNILSVNNNAKTLFSLTPGDINFFETLTTETNTVINDFIEYSYENKTNKTDNIFFSLKNGTEFNARIIVSTFKDDDEIIVFISIYPQDNKIEVNGITNLQIKSADITTVIKNREILKIIDEIKSLYPFTFIGRERILKIVNQFDELFWIKNIDGNYILVNNKLASGLGLKLSQIEGKPVESFLQPYLIEFTKAVDKYIRDTVNCIVMEGVPVSGLAIDDGYQTVQVPLNDADNNVIAIIGIGQKIERIKKEDRKELSINPESNLIDGLPKVMAVVDKNGIIKHGSQEFCKLFSDEIVDLRGYYFSKVFPLKITDKIKQFLDSSISFENFELDEQLKSGKNEPSKYVVLLNKILGKDNNYEGFSIFVEEPDIDNNFENLIKKRGRMFEILIQSNPEPMFIYDTENLRFIEVNDAALQLYGFRKDEFLQMDLTDLYSPEDIQTLLDSSSVSAKEGKFTGPFKHKKKDGSYVFVEISKISFNYKDKNAHFNIIKDVTDKLELERKNQVFRNAFENTGDLLLLTDNVGLITYVNNSVLKNLGYQKAELENMSFSALVKNEDRGTVNSTIFQSHMKEPVSLMMALKKNDGSFVETELTASPVLNYKDEIESFSLIGKILKTASEPPAGEIKEVIKEVIVERPVQVNANIPVGNNVNFLSSLFHEILTPINVILGFVQELTEGFDNPTPEQKEATDIINQNRDRLLNTMNSVIEYSNIEKKDYRITPEEIAITQVIDQLYNDFKDLVGTRDIEFAYGKISSSLKFETDKQKFQTLIGMLVKIAAQISKEKKIYFSAYQYEDDSFAISIKDNYSAVSKSFLKNFAAIFESEEILLSKDFGISKLTYRLTKSLLGLLNGRFEIIEQSDDKTDYAFIFPINLSDALQGERHVNVSDIPVHSIEPEETVLLEEEPADEIINLEEPENQKDFPAEFTGEIVEEEITREEPVKHVKKAGNNIELKSLNCLYIEDQVDSQILFKVQMKELKDIKFAVSFEEALPLLDNFHFDFIVMDINLQGEYNGLDALKIIHKMPGYENIPIIAVTAYVLPGDKEKFIATGFNDFISKPIFREKMIDSLEKIFLMQS